MYNLLIPAAAIQVFKDIRDPNRIGGLKAIAIKKATYNTYKLTDRDSQDH